MPESEIRALAIHRLRFRFPGGPEVICGIELAVREGERVAVVGPNAAGKTTLLLLCVGLLRGQGDIRIFGQPLTPSTLKTLRSQAGMVFQDADDQLFSTSVFDDVAFGPLNLGLDAKGVKARVSEALDIVGMKGAEKRSPFHLSGGEKKRVALATALAMKPRLLFLDEPSGDLDPRSRRQLIEFLNQLPQTLVVA
ncbi:MAG: ABC transporter ATP-binding protein, partial [bacterium]